MIYAEEVDAPDAALAAAEHSLGDPHATVTLLEYGDYECPACVRAEPLRRGLIAAFSPRLRFMFRHYPLVELHANAELAAEAAEAAAAQGQFWPMHALLLSQTRKLTLPVITAYAKTIELDMLRFNGEMADRIYTQRVQEHRRAGMESGVHTTPSFFLNGTLIDVSDGFDTLEDAVHAALAGK